MVLKRRLPALLLVAAAALALAACGQPRKLDFPQEVPGGWKLYSKAQLPVTSAPQQIQSNGLVSWWQAEYAGAPFPTVFLYEMQTAASAFEMVQTHRSTPGVIALNIDRAFITMQTARGTMPELNRFASAFEKVF